MYVCKVINQLRKFIILLIRHSIYYKEQGWQVYDRMSKTMD